MKVAGIRKPRIGGCKLLNAVALDGLDVRHVISRKAQEMDEKRWLLPHCEPSGRCSRAVS